MPPQMSGLHATPVAPEARGLSTTYCRQSGPAGICEGRPHQASRRRPRVSRSGVAFGSARYPRRGKETSVYVVPRRHALTESGRRTSIAPFLVVRAFPVAKCAYIAANARQLTGTQLAAASEKGRGPRHNDSSDREGNEPHRTYRRRHILNYKEGFASVPTPAHLNRAAAVCIEWPNRRIRASASANGPFTRRMNRLSLHSARSLSRPIHSHELQRHPVTFAYRGVSSAILVSKAQRGGSVHTPSG